jgi:hypothetical protein
MIDPPEPKSHGDKALAYISRDRSSGAVID